MDGKCGSGDKDKSAKIDLAGRFEGNDTVSDSPSRSNMWMRVRPSKQAHPMKE